MCGLSVEKVRGLGWELEAEREKVAGVGVRAAREGARSREGMVLLGRGCAAPCEDGWPRRLFPPRWSLRACCVWALAGP